MNQGKYVFSQMVSHLGRNHFNYLTRKYDGNKYVKHLSCWNQLLAMMFGQLSNRESLRDVVVAWEAHHSKCKFLGIGSKPIAKTTLASANQNRDYRIFEDFAFYMMKEACEKRAINLKWLKQHFKIKKFWGTTENAVRIQIAVAIITYCIVDIVPHDMKLGSSTYEV